MRLGILSFRNFYEFFGSGATDGADEVGGEFFTFHGENTVVASVFFHDDYSLILTVAAKTGEGQLAAFNTAAGAGFAKLRGNGNLVHIHHGIAAAADEVNVGVCICIETFHSVYGSNAGDLSLLFEKSQIPVDCCL